MDSSAENVVTAADAAKPKGAAKPTRRGQPASKQQREAPQTATPCNKPQQPTPLPSTPIIISQSTTSRSPSFIMDWSNPSSTGSGPELTPLAVEPSPTAAPTQQHQPAPEASRREEHEAQVYLEQMPQAQQRVQPTQGGAAQGGGGMCAPGAGAATANPAMLFFQHQLTNQQHGNQPDYHMPTFTTPAGYFISQQAAPGGPVLNTNSNCSAQQPFLHVGHVPYHLAMSIMQMPGMSSYSSPYVGAAPPSHGMTAT
eukprot:6172612-Pleurochrysis_carterae.AAC.4